MNKNQFRNNYNFQRTVWWAPIPLMLEPRKPEYEQRVCKAVARRLEDESLYILVESRSGSDWRPVNNVLSVGELRTWMCAA